MNEPWLKFLVIFLMIDLLIQRRESSETQSEILRGKSYEGGVSYIYISGGPLGHSRLELLLCTSKKRENKIEIVLFGEPPVTGLGCDTHSQIAQQIKQKNDRP